MSESYYKSIGAKIPTQIDEKIDAAVSKGYYLNRSELLRNALRDLLNNIELEAED